MRDGIAIARKGKPAVTLVTEVFKAQGDFIAKANGMPDVPRVTLPHPVAGTGEAAMRETAHSIVEQICAYLEGRAGH
ncbi:MAG: hypothetical protein AAF458_08680 [Pseudomonadota bacterium]